MSAQMSNNALSNDALVQLLGVTWYGTAVYVDTLGQAVVSNELYMCNVINSVGQTPAGVKN